jgi:predicted secreted Zn-dependent protease
MVDGGVPFGRRERTVVATTLVATPRSDDATRSVGGRSDQHFTLRLSLALAGIALLLIAYGAAHLMHLIEVATPRTVSAAADRNTYPTPEAVLNQFPNTNITYYDVHGADLISIRHSMSSAGLIDEHDGKRVDAQTNWHIDFHWPGGINCGLDRATANFRATVVLPRLETTNEVSPAVLAAWRRYAYALAVHEAGHVEHAYNHMPDVLAAVRGSTCGRAISDGNEAIAQLVAYDRAYDAETNHGLAQGARFP